MNESAPITWVIGRINEIIATGSEATAATLASTISPLVAICFGIYILLITISYMRGTETEPVLDFGLRCAGFAVVIGLGLNAANYTAIVIPIVIGLGGDLANAVSGGTATAGTLDQLALYYLDIISKGFRAASELGFPDDIPATLLVLSKSAIIILGLVPFLVAAALAIIIANIGSMLVAMVGPIFFACLLFPATRQYFSSWVNTAFSYALIPLFVAVIAVISVGISKEMLSTSGNLLEASYSSVFLAAIGNLMLLFVLRQVSALASSLSAGGINAAMPGGVGSMASSVRDGIRGTARDVKGIHAAGKTAAGAGRAVANRFNSIRKAG